MQKKINALSRRMIGEIIHVLQQLEADESIKVLIVRAAGNHFCAGHNLEELVDQGMKEYKFIFDQCTRMMQMLHDIPQPVIAQVQRIATAAGCQLAAWCEEGAKFATHGVQLGLFCTTHGSHHQGHRPQSGNGNAAHRSFSSRNGSQGAWADQ